MWHRLAIALTLVWLIGAPIYSHQTTVAANERAAQARLASCFGPSPSTIKAVICGELENNNPRPDNGAIWKDAILNAVMIAAIAWAVGLFLYFMIRWIGAGRRENSN
jgi:hypothetical protein